MPLFAAILTGVIALAHVWFLVLESFLWTQPFGMRTFGMTPEVAQTTAVLAQNQGLYNGFLAAGLLWTYFVGDAAWQVNLRTFFLVCVIVAGLVGGYTAKPVIYFIQALPALIALIVVRLAARG